MSEISIVLPAYNGERYIRESIDSVLHQTFRDWELIIVDDCSTDGTPEIAEAYAALDARIRVIHNTVNEKLPEALNIGFRQAEGRYLTWTSDDNMYLSHALEDMHAYLEGHSGTAMVCAGMLYIDQDKRVIKEWSVYNDQRMYIENAVGACFLYRREVLQTVGEYARDLFGVEDYDYWLRIFREYGSIGFIHGTLYLYRCHEASLTVMRREEIHRIWNKLRVRNLSWMLPRVKELYPEIFIWLYNDLISEGVLDMDAKRQFEAYVPELEGDTELSGNAPVFIFGAGGMGKRVYRFLEDRAAAFVDSDPSKTGQVYCGLPIRSVDELEREYARGGCQVVIGTTSEKQLEIMRALRRRKILRYTIYPRIDRLLIWEEERPGCDS